LRRFFAVVIACLVVLRAAPPAAAQLSSELLPTYSGCYEDLKALALKGLVPFAMANTRPLTRGQAARILADGMKANGSALLADPLGRRMLRRFSTELHRMGVETPFERHRPFWRREIRDGTRAGEAGERREGRNRTAKARGGVRVEIVPYAWVRVDNVEPIYFGKLADRRIGLRGTAATPGGVITVHDDVVAGNHSDEPRGIPDFGTLNALVEGEDFNTWIHRAYVRLSTKVIDLTYARDWLRWGPGRTGTLGLGDASRALNYLALRKRTGRFDLTSFVATLDYGDEEMLAGHRLEVQASENLVLGIAEQVRFRTFQQVPIYFLAFYPYTFVEKVVNGDTAAPTDWRNNVMLSVDGDWMPAPGTRVYGEFLLDDWSFSSDRKPAQLAYQLGMSRCGFGPLRGLLLTAEITKVHRYTYSQARRAHEEGETESPGVLDFEHNGYCLGHPLGPDSEGYLLAAAYDASPATRWEVSLEIRRHGELELGQGWSTGDPVPATFPLSGVVETRTRFMLGCRWYPAQLAGSEISVGGGLRKVSNAGHVEGEDRNWAGILAASVSASW